uniref:Uncharacterized protein n=1 Tax=Anguilla anguilla TaxID=7936 RepID=A0A0E9RM37_ANGAN
MRSNEDQPYARISTNGDGRHRASRPMGTDVSMHPDQWGRTSMGTDLSAHRAN